MSIIQCSLLEAKTSEKRMRWLVFYKIFHTTLDLLATARNTRNIKVKYEYKV